MSDDSRNSQSGSLWSEITSHFIGLAEGMGHLRAHADHASQRLTQLEARQSDLSHQMVRLETKLTAAICRPTPASAHGQPPGTEEPRKRWRLLLTIINQVASVGPTVLNVLVWVAVRAAAIWVLIEGYLTGMWKFLLGALF